MRIGGHFATGLVLACVALWAPTAAAIEPEQREAVVVSARVWEGDEYREVFIPSTSDEMTVMAGHPSAITFVRTLEYYWPLSRQVYVDFQRQRDIVEGDLVIRQDGVEVGRQKLDVFSILYPEGAVNGDGSLLWGEEARRAYAEYQEQERAFVREFAAAQRAHSDYERHLLAAGAARQAGEAPETIDPPPPLPKPSLRLVTPPEPGFVIAINPGTYTIALERDGQTVPGTERRLRAIDLEGGAVLVADIVPAERWTRPLAANTPEARIYAKPGAVFYLTVIEASRFEEAAYLPIVSPQAEPVPDRSIWIRRRPADIATLDVTWGSSTSELARGPLKVDQTRGSSYGYTVRAARAGEAADLDAFSVGVPQDPLIAGGTIAYDGENGPPFVREIIVVHPRRAGLGLALALVPLAGFVLLGAWRRLAG